MKEKIERFIKENGLTFVKGCRNTELVVICGYSQYLESLNETPDAELILVPVLEPYFKKDAELKTEFTMVWNYTKHHSYYKWWDDEDNRSKYII